jgi:MinD-like ATPase involved in chromosome partitioning or flagellar assembly/CheY-like chemotaxis protein
MTSSINTFVALDEGVDSSLVEAALPVGSPLKVVGVVEGLDRGWSILEETAPELLLVACARYSERALYLIEGASKQRPDRPVVVLYTGEPDGFMQRAFDAGADDLLTLPLSSDQIIFALEKVMARRRSASLDTTVCPMICVLGPKGGTGKTVTSCNLAAALALAGKRTVIIDLDLQFGDVGIAFGLTPERTMHDLVRSGGSIDPEKVDSFLVDHPAGVRALLGPRRPDQATAIGVDFLRDVYAAVRTTNDFVIIDTAPGFTPEVIASIDSSSDLCVVGMLDALSLKDTKLGLETLELMGYDGSNIRLVLNRAGSKVGITHGDMEKILGRRPDVFVPSDADVPRSMTDGNPIVLGNERSPVAKAYRTLAGLYLGEHHVLEASNGNGGERQGRKSLLLRRRRKGA